MQTSRTDRRLTYDDLLLLPDDGLRHEIIDGEHCVTPSPNVAHQRLVGRLHTAFALYLRDHPDAGEIFVARLDVVFSRYDVVEPDLLFVAGDQANILTVKNVQGAPALVIEVLSPGTRKTDEQAKRQLFDRGGVREYWLVDPDSHRIRIFRRAPDAAFSCVADLSENHHETLTTPLLSGFALPLDEVFQDIHKRLEL